MSYSNHPHYRRWKSFVQRCDNPKNPAYPAYGGRGIVVCDEWSSSNPQGFENFKTWVDTQVQKDPTLSKDADAKFEVVRKGHHEPIGPLTCELKAPGAGTQIRRTAVLDAVLVAALRREKKADPELSLSQMELRHGVSVANLSRCLRGVTWAAANALEAPLLSLLAPVDDSRRVIHPAQG